MRPLTKALARFLTAEDGPTAVEYAVLLALVITVCITVIATIGTTTHQSYSSTGEMYPAGS